MQQPPCWKENFWVIQVCIPENKDRSLTWSYVWPFPKWSWCVVACTHMWLWNIKTVCHSAVLVKSLRASLASSFQPCLLGREKQGWYEGTGSAIRRAWILLFSLYFLILEVQRTYLHVEHIQRHPFFVLTRINRTIPKSRPLGLQSWCDSSKIQNLPFLVSICYANANYIMCSTPQLLQLLKNPKDL